MPTAMRTTRSYAYNATTPDDHYLHIDNVRGKPADRLQPATPSPHLQHAWLTTCSRHTQASASYSTLACTHAN